ncbi:TetR/AcrR family transcriptional regulator [Lacisediminihabitans sp.]|uniref:TetR/AcrR family transcriptional regulator n=1 Tax=Lacisediminihabitans sp. TaxID=2787631 RepID=UPI002F94FE8D
MSISRTYNSSVRDRDAAETRERIITAAGRLFARDGYFATPMRAIAAEAGVSVQSVHLAGPKSSLLLAAWEHAFAGDEGAHSLLERPAMAQILAEPDSTVALTRFVAFVVEANARGAGIWRAMRTAADADPQVRAAASAQDARRRADLALGAGWFASRGLVDPSNQNIAADVLGFLTAEESFLYFVEDSGWPLERYQEWLLQSIQLLILDGQPTRMS